MSGYRLADVYPDLNPEQAYDARPIDDATWSRMRATDVAKRDALNECADLLTVAAAVVRDDGNESRAARMESTADAARKLARVQLAEP